MYVLSVCKKFCPEKIPFQLGESLGDGSDGEVLSLVDEKDKVIKLGILYDLHSSISLLQSYRDIRASLDYLIDNPIHGYARIYNQEYIGSYLRASQSNDQEFILYYYVMEKLNKISEDEKKVFHTILSHEDRNIVKNYSADKLAEVLSGLQCGLDFDMKKVIIFYENIRVAPIQHLDMHPRNIMKDGLGNYKLVDLDHIKLERV